MRSVYCNFDLNTDVFKNNKFDIGGNISDYCKGSSGDLSSLIDVKFTPEFEMDMDILKSDDRSFRFSFTNNSDKPVQFCLYIDEADNKDIYNFERDGYLKKLSYENALWNYKREGYYYDLNFVNNSKYLGIKVDHTLNPTKVHGTTVWHYLKPNETYSDVVYWANVNVTTGKKYKINARACYVPSNSDYPSNIIDIDCLSDSAFIDKYIGDLAEHHWWTVDFLSEITFSDKMKQYSIDSEDIYFLYQKEFSLVSVPDFTNTVLGGNGTLSKGYKNDKDQFSSFDYKMDLDTGNETFGDGSSLSQLENEIDIENVKTGDVISYLKYCLSFFLIVKQAFTCFPPYIWVTIYFGITAMVVIGVVKSIL